MRIIVGSYKLKIANDFLSDLAELLPALEFMHEEFVPAADLRDLSADSGLGREQLTDKMLTALLERRLSAALYKSEMLPEEVPDELDCFSLPERYCGSAAETGVAGLTLLFRRGDAVMTIIRNLLLPPVIFAGAGIGGVDNVTLGVVKALEGCDVCVYDALIPDGIIDFLPESAEKIFVGKRRGRHYMKQDEINRLLVELGKSGKKVVRLKGGDPSVFGRLAEEVDFLQREALSFRVLPGITSLNVAAAGSGLLPSRRGVNRGFTISTPRRAGSHDFVPLSLKERQESFNVYYMAANLVPEIVATMRADGFPAEWPVSLIFDAGGWTETVVCGTLADIVLKISLSELKNRPALVLTGKSAAESYLFQTNAALEKRRTICCGSERRSYVQVKTAIEDFGGKSMFVAADALASEELDIYALEYDAIIFLDGKSRQDFYARFGSQALTGKVVIGVAVKSSQSIEFISVPDFASAGLRLAAYFSNCKIEMMCADSIKMENCNGR